MSSRLSAWLRQAHRDLVMAVYASQGGFHAQARRRAKYRAWLAPGEDHAMTQGAACHCCGRQTPGWA